METIDEAATAPAPLAPAPLAPVQNNERIASLDVIRGFALLGILLMNIVGFGLYHSAYDDPTVAGGATGVNLAVWVGMHILAEGKMRCLFSMVFGASVVLLTTRTSADIYYRRTLWLLAFGLVHAYLLWQGDILYPYALCGLILYPFRNVRARNLMITGGVLMFLMTMAVIGMGFEQKEKIANARAAEAAIKEGRQPTEEQKDAKKEWDESREKHKPSAEKLENDAKAWRGNLISVVKARAKLVTPWHSNPYYSPWNWDMWSMMFLGMGLFKLGVFNAERSFRFYGWLAAIGYAVGIPVNSYTAWLTVRSNFDPTVQTFTFTTYDLGRLSIALAHLSVLLLLCKSGAARWLTSRLGAVGQMAFSNYIFHSIVCSTIFTGVGFGMYGKLQRYQLYYVVLAIWVFQLIVSPIWLRHYRMGPLEWCWRSLTYWKRQPMRIAQPEPQASVAVASIQ